ncbi:MAG: hypothetical protein GY797_08625 [Deltaproteobacteria bacterium]|nr:hypothetical protein [Deltaproteobacteria bacterium]
MYLVPADETKIEYLVKPDRFVNQKDVTVGVTSDWGYISRFANRGSVYAIIIHHAAVDQVNRAELKDLYRHKRLVVVGIGIPTNQFARIIDHPSFHDEKVDNLICAPSICFVIATTRKPDLSGNGSIVVPDDLIDQIEFGMQSHMSAGSLVDEESIQTLLGQVKGSIWNMRRDYNIDGVEPTLTWQEIEILLKHPSKN